MGFQNAGLVLRMIYNYRFCHIGGRFGGGKTAIAYRLAYELMEKFEFRYLLSNVKSVWNDDLSKVELRKDKDGVGRFVDAVIILDEAGEFINSASQARQWLSFLRKLNIVILLPSVMPPYHSMRLLSIRRKWNLFAVGIPYWGYAAKLSAEDDDMKIDFGWWNPSEIYGIYDTLGYPTDADEILNKIKTWVSEVSGATGYEKTAARNKVVGIPSSARSLNASASEALEDFRGEIDYFSQVASETKRDLSLLGRKTKGRGRP